MYLCIYLCICLCICLCIYLCIPVGLRIMQADSGIIIYFAARCLGRDNAGGFLRFFRTGAVLDQFAQERDQQHHRNADRDAAPA